LCVCSHHNVNRSALPDQKTYKLRRLIGGDAAANTQKDRFPI